MDSRLKNSETKMIQFHQKNYILKPKTSKILLHNEKSVTTTNS